MNKEFIHAWVQASRTEKTVMVLAVVLTVLQPAQFAIKQSPFMGLDASAYIGLYIWLPQAALMFSMVLFEARPANITGVAIAVSLHCYMFLFLYFNAEDGEEMLGIAVGYFLFYAGLAMGAWFSVLICRKRQFATAWAHAVTTALATLAGNFALVLLALI